MMGPYEYVVARIDGDYAVLRRTDNDTHDEILVARALLPEEFASLRHVLRVNAEIRGGQSAYLEFNTAVQSGGVRGWLNIGAWENVSLEKQGKGDRVYNGCADDSLYAGRH